MTQQHSPDEVRYRWGRQIGPWGTTARALLGTGAVAGALAAPHRHPLGNIPGSHTLWWNILLGLVVLPGAAVLILALRGRAAPPLRIGSGGAILASVAFVALAQVIPVASMLFLGVTMVTQAVRGADGCELMELPNVILRRNDRLFCLPLTPIDKVEARHHAIAGRNR